MTNPKKLKKFEEHILPSMIKLGYQDITIVEVETLDYTQGSYTNESHEIKIKKGMDSKEKLNTILHEILHACVYVYGLKNEFKDDDHEEKIVNALGNAMTEALVRNPDLIKFINKSI